MEVAVADPTHLYRWLPDVWDRDPESDQYKIMGGLAKGTEDARVELGDYRDDLSLARADGQGLDRWGENFSIARPPGMIDDLYRNVVAIIAGGRRGTVAIVKAVLEAATGLVWTVKDRQLDIDEGTSLGIPLYEIWAKTSATGDTYGKAYASFDTHIDGSPEESGIGGPVLDALDVDGGRYNDHTVGMGNLNAWTLQLVEKVRPGGVKVVYKDF